MCNVIHVLLCLKFENSVTVFPPDCYKTDSSEIPTNALVILHDWCSINWSSQMKLQQYNYTFLFAQETDLQCIWDTTALIIYNCWLISN